MTIRTNARAGAWTARAALLVTAGLALAGCASHTDGSPSSAVARAPQTTSVPPPKAALPMSVRLVPTNGADAVNPAAPITVSVAHGTLRSVVLMNTATELVVHGAVSTGGTAWTAGQALGYGKHYRLTATAVNSDGRATTKTAAFSTFTPPHQASAYLDTIYGNALVDGATYGIGMIPVVSFDTPVVDRAAAERALHVTTSPHVDGSWEWLDSKHVHWRPRSFYAPGSRVTIDAQLYGVRLGGGVYGASDEHVSFVIGAKHVAIADDTTHLVKVYFDGKLMRTMPTSMGQHTGEYVNGSWISFYTMDGVYTVLGHENPAIMSSASYGLPLGAPGSYPPEKIYWSTKISTDLPARAGQHDSRSGSRRPVARLSEPQSGQCRMVLHPLPRRGRRPDPAQRRTEDQFPAGWRLVRPVVDVDGRQRAALTEGGAEHTLPARLVRPTPSSSSA